MFSKICFEFMLIFYFIKFFMCEIVLGKRSRGGDSGWGGVMRGKIG